MKHLAKLLLVMAGFGLSIIATSAETDAQTKGRKKKHGEGCIGKGACGKTKAGKEMPGQYRVW